MIDPVTGRTIYNTDPNVQQQLRYIRKTIEKLLDKLNEKGQLTKKELKQIISDKGSR